MQINHVVENEDTTTTVTGVLSQEETQLVMSVGLNVIYAQGLLSQLVPSLDENVHEAPEGLQ